MLKIVFSLDLPRLRSKFLSLKHQLHIVPGAATVYVCKIRYIVRQVKHTIPIKHIHRQCDKYKYKNMRILFITLLSYSTETFRG